MDQRNRRFLKIVTVEIDDIQDDLELLVNTLTQRYQDGAITEYVYNENLAFLRHEMRGSRSVREAVASIDPSCCEDLDALVAHIKERVKEHVHNHDLAKAIELMVDRKLDKVHDYVKQSEPLT